MYDPNGSHPAKAYDAFSVRAHSEGKERLNDAMELRFFIVGKLPEDDTLLPKHVAVGS
jgi:hypothetical protein